MNIFNGLIGLVYIGEGQPPIPKPIVEKIADWKFIDMAELLPEFWALLCG